VFYFFKGESALMQWHSSVQSSWPSDVGAYLLLIWFN
jgi:hypothetical protein